MSLPLPKTEMQRAWNLATQIAEQSAELNDVLRVMNEGKISFITLDDAAIVKIQNEQYNVLKASIEGLVKQLP